MKCLDFCFVLFLLCFNFLVTLCHNLSINKWNIWLLSNRGSSPENSLSSPPPLSSVMYTLYSTHQTVNVSWAWLASLYFCVYVYVAFSSWDVFIFPCKFCSRIKARMSLLSVKSSKGFSLPTCGEGEHDFHNTLSMCLLYFSPLWYICLYFPLNPASWGQKLSLLHFYTPVFSSGVTLGSEGFSLPITEVWAS